MLSDEPSVCVVYAVANAELEDYFTTLERLRVQSEFWLKVCCDRPRSILRAINEARVHMLAGQKRF